MGPRTVTTERWSRRTLLFVGAVLLSGALLLGAWQGYRYERLLAGVRTLEQQQRQWLERNKQTITSIAVFRSPRRVEAVATGELGLERVAPERRLQVLVDPARGSDR